MGAVILADLETEYEDLPSILAKRISPENGRRPMSQRRTSFKFAGKHVDITFQKPLAGRSIGVYSDTDDRFSIFVNPELDYTVLKSEVMARIIGLHMESQGFEERERESFVQRFQEKYLLGEMRV